MPVLTPDGTKYDPKSPTIISECWITDTQFPNFLTYASDPAKQPFLDQYIIIACDMVNRYCNRYFNEQTIDQIFPNTVLTIRDYTSFALTNKPLIEVLNMWVEVTNSFAPINLEFLQVLTREAIVKILPNFSVYAQTTLPMWALPTSTNFWIRYTSGYTTVTIPPEVARATALLVDYLFGLDSITPNVTSFRTQTYSQTNSNVTDDPILGKAWQLLDRFKQVSFYGVS